MLYLIQGPAGGGKSRIAREIVRRPNTVMADITQLWAAVGAYERPYPIRQDDDPALAVALYIQVTIARFALREGHDVVVTSARHQVDRWQAIADEYDSPLHVQTVDPGEDIVRSRLAVNGVLSPECERAIGRWYAA